jgi:hypothetical protein
MQADSEVIDGGGVFDLLTMAAGADFRTAPSDLEIELWLAVLTGLRFGDCKAAVIAHYTSETRRLMPADVRTLVDGWREQWLMVHPSKPYEDMPIGGGHQAAMISGPQLAAQLEARRRDEPRALGA